MANKVRQIFSSKKIVFMTVASGVFMSTMDSSMVNVALPTLVRAFQTPLHVTQWVVQIYLLTVTVSLIFWGKVGDHWGRGRVYSLGMAIFVTGSLLCSVALTLQLLVFFRLVQAIGASMMMATGPALVTSVFSQGRLGRGLGMIGVAVSLGLMSGPVMSGLLIRWYHWRLLFFITVPVGLFFYCVSRNALKEVDRNDHTQQCHNSSEENSRAQFSFDWAGGILYVTGITTTLLTLSHVASLQRNSLSGSDPFVVIGCLLSVLLWYLFFKRESHFDNPLLPLQLLGRLDYRMAIVSAVLSFAVLFVVLLLTPFFLDHVLALQADRIGLIMMALPIAVFVVSPGAGWLYDHIGARLVATGGLLICLLSLCFLITIIPTAKPGTVAMSLAMLGCGQAAFLSPNSAALLSSVHYKHTGVTASLLATARNMGMLLGVALGSLIFSWYFARYTGGMDVKDYSPEMIPAFIKALQWTLYYAVLLAFSGVIVSWMRGIPGGED